MISVRLTGHSGAALDASGDQYGAPAGRQPGVRLAVGAPRALRAFRAI